MAERTKSSFTARNDTIEHYLVDMARHCGEECWVYGFVAKHGRLFGPTRPLPKGCRRGLPQRCFWNAYQLTCQRPELAYVEGFARFLVGRSSDYIAHHAWTVDASGLVCDPTRMGTEYFGVAFNSAYVKKAMLRILPSTSLLDNEEIANALRKARSSEAWLMKA